MPVFYVPYIQNGYIYDFLTKHGNTATAEMLSDLPFCPHNDRLALMKSVQSLKEKRKTLMKARFESVENENVFQQQFLNAEFVFRIYAIPGTSRSLITILDCACSDFYELEFYMLELMLF